MSAPKPPQPAAKSLADALVASWGSERPSRRAIAWLATGVLALHLVLLWSLTGGIDWRLKADETIRVAPLQTRWIAPPLAPLAAPAQPVSEKPRTRLAMEARKPPAAPKPPQTPPPNASSATPETTNSIDTTTSKAASDAASAATPDTTPDTSPDSTPATLPAPLPAPLSAPTAATPLEAERVTDNTPNATQKPEPATGSAPASEQAVLAAPTPATMALPPIPLGALPPPVLLSYRLSGQEKGLNYFADGELRWQHNDSAYALSLSVKAFLVGSRHWRSQGAITSAGLAPTRFSDSWRNERAAHFDRAQNRVVFSNNAPIATLEPGAQDQISLYVQLAAAMAGEPQRFQPGTRLQVQTATIRDALPWLLTLAPAETLQLDGQTLPTVKWVCQPRNRFDATVEFWVSAQHAWMPVRIRITQLNGSYIDLVLRGQEPLPPLPQMAPA